MGQYYKLVKKVNENYYDIEINDFGVKLMEIAYTPNGLNYALCRYSKGDEIRLGLIGDYSDEYSSICPKSHSTPRAVLKIPEEKYPNTYIVNLDKKIYLSTKDYKYINPLPLLISKGNGLGLGDYRGINQDLCGTWFFDNLIFSLGEPPKSEGFRYEIIKFEED